MSTDGERRRAPAEVEIRLETSGRAHAFQVDLGAMDEGRAGPGSTVEDAADAAGPAQVADLLEHPVLETERVTLAIQARSPIPLDRVEVEIHLGNVLVGSTSGEGLDVQRLARAGPERLEMAPCQAFLDCAGLAFLEVRTRWGEEDAFACVARVPLRVLPAKVTPEELDQLISDLEEAASGVLFDAYAKTSIGLRRAGGERRRVPAEELEQIRAILNLFGTELERISNRPAQRLTLSPRRVGIYPGESITPETLASIAEDTSLLTRTRTGVVPRERVEMAAERDVRLPEHAALSGFLALMAEETRTNLARIQEEAARRLRARRSFAPGDAGIWARREEPRVRALGQLEGRARTLLSLCRHLRRRHDFLPPEAPPLRQAPELTKRFAHVGAYSVLYRAMRGYYQGHEVDLEDRSFLLGARSLPILWEYWVVLKVIGFLQRKLRYALSPWESAESLFRRLTGFRDTYQIDLASNRSLELSDAGGRRIRFRYEPRYGTMPRGPRGAGPAASRGRGAAFGRLRRRGGPYEPDISIELYPRGASEADLPEHVVLFDAKYTSRPHEEVLESVIRYRNIGEFRTGKRLVRQIWAVTNACLPPPPEAERASLEASVTVDNEAFFEEDFSPLGEVCGVIGLRPGKEGAQTPLDLLLARVFAIFAIAGN